MYILPIVNLLVRLLRIENQDELKGESIVNQGVSNLSFQLHAVPKMNGQLSNKTERMLIRSLVIETENLRS
jgi:hypothetical protein